MHRHESTADGATRKLGPAADPAAELRPARPLALDFDLSLPPDLYALRARLLLRHPSSVAAVAPPATAQRQFPPTPAAVDINAEDCHRHGISDCLRPEKLLGPASTAGSPTPDGPEPPE